jgi:hypothetical protein
MIASSPATAYIEELLNRDEPFPFGEATHHEMIMAGIKAGIFSLLSGWQLSNKGRDEHGRDVFFMHRYLAADDPETEVQRMVEEEMKKPRLRERETPRTSEIDDSRERGRSPRDCGARLRRR